MIYQSIPAQFRWSAIEHGQSVAIPVPHAENGIAPVHRRAMIIPVRWNAAKSRIQRVGRAPPSQIRMPFDHPHDVIVWRNVYEAIECLHALVVPSQATV